MKFFKTVCLLMLINIYGYAQENTLAFKLKIGNSYYMNGSSVSEVQETVNGQQVKVKVGTDVYNGGQWAI